MFCDGRGRGKWLVGGDAVARAGVNLSICGASLCLCMDDLHLLENHNKQLESGVDDNYFEIDKNAYNA